MTHKHFALLLILASILLSCEKARLTNTEVVGTALNLTDQEPLAHYDVHLVAYASGSIPFSPVGRELIATATTDAQGTFTFVEALKKRSKYEYMVEFEPRNELFAPAGWREDDFGPVVSQVSVSKGELNQPQLRLVKLGQLNIEVENRSEEQVKAEVVLSHEYLENQQFSRTIDPKASESNENYYDFIAGELTATIQISSASLSVTRDTSFVLDHNEALDLNIVHK